MMVVVVAAVEEHRRDRVYQVGRLLVEEDLEEDYQLGQEACDDWKMGVYIIWKFGWK